MVPGRSNFDLWQKSGTGTDFSPSSSISPCQQHSAIAPYSSSSSHSSYQKDKREQPEKTNTRRQFLANGPRGTAISVDQGIGKRHSQVVWFVIYFLRSVVIKVAVPTFHSVSKNFRCNTITRGLAKLPHATRFLKCIREVHFASLPGYRPFPQVLSLQNAGMLYQTMSRPFPSLSL